MFCHQSEQQNPFSVSPDTQSWTGCSAFSQAESFFLILATTRLKGKKNVVVREAVLKGHRSPPVTA